MKRTGGGGRELEREEKEEEELELTTRLGIAHIRTRISLTAGLYMSLSLSTFSTACLFKIIQQLEHDVDNYR